MAQAGAGASEWRACELAAIALGDGGAEVVFEMSLLPCFLLMEFVPGASLFRCDEAFQVSRGAGRLCLGVCPCAFCGCGCG